ncbi:sugar nucleotide-binding protein [Jiangella sp. DSM 45060]|uniref:SDR family oxidoreductase n=1 Tax=Jiangella sp. DSM 45060 TaxID=1798224 RepID=UPI00087CAF5E|nr:sugar nucleotide-binding protein [Jiangella sp. DSM 45060]SDS29336.1 dTDP-4-dehydrorhamnose reductase [Jiangella sp. DSM 45060]
MKVLVVGGSGFLGGELVRQARAAGHDVAATYLTRPGGDDGVVWRALDVRRRDDVGALVAAVRPDVVVNAAYRQSDWAITADGAAHVALAAAASAVRLVHVSSDAVFSGAAVHYDETAVPDPVNPYGAAKAAAETAVRAIAPHGVVVRTSLIIGDGGSPQEAFVHDLAAGRRDGVLFTDDIRCPVHVADLAAALLELAASARTGTHHVAGPDAVSRYDLGRLIARRDGLDGAALPAGTRAASGPPGPLDVRLDSRATQTVLQTRLRGAREFLTAGTVRPRD